MDINALAEEVAKRIFIPLEASGRHVHLTKEQAITLFGHPLTPKRELSQPGQFLSNERVKVVGPKGEFGGVAVLGPERPEGQVEISLTDGRSLGIEPPVRPSGKVAGTPGITLRGCTDGRFKQSVLSIQFIRPMCREEAALNALLPAVLLRGCQSAPDLRSITMRLDDLYGASVGSQLRRVGDYQTTGFNFGFIEDRYALSGDRILAAVVDFLRELLLEPVLEDGAFARDFVEGEKRNLIAAIEAQRNDKRVYASARMMELMCREDSFGIPRLGTKEDVAAITAQIICVTVS